MIHYFGYTILCLDVVDIHTQYIYVSIEIDFDFRLVWITPFQNYECSKICVVPT